MLPPPHFYEEEEYVVKIQKRNLFTKNKVKEVNGILITGKKLSLKNTEELFDYVNDINKYGLSKLKTDNPEKERQSIRVNCFFETSRYSNSIFTRNDF